MKLPGSTDWYRLTALLLVALLLPVAASAHAADIDFSKFSRTDIGLMYLDLGFEHIVPKGLDHILFVLCIFLLNRNLKQVLLQATAFTVAHSITLGMAMFKVFTPPVHIVEPVIALSIFYVAVENCITEKLHPSRLLIVFLFGLIHGMGFASVLTDLGLPEKEFVTALITFNVGVELGQIVVILAAWLCIGLWFWKKPWYHKRVVIPLSVVIGIIALYWTITRIFFEG